MIFDVKNITFSYNKGKINDTKVFNDLSVRIEKGKFNGILGPNGCGKTTFLDLLVKHVKPANGEIFYGKKKLNEISTRDYSREVALVSQNFYINFGFTVEEIVMMGRHPYIPRFSSPCVDDYEIVTDIMKQTDVYRFRNKYVTQLSGGERQRVVFARALAQDTPVLILDEATSNLDISHTIAMMNIVSKRVKNKNRTVISVIQDINLAAMYCDNLLFLKNGKLAASGNTSEVLNEDNIKKVFNVETKINEDSFSGRKSIVYKR